MISRRALFAALLIGALATPATAETFVVLGARNRLPAGLESAVTRAGGASTTRLDALGVALVTSKNRDFAAELSTLPGLRSVTPDLTIRFVDARRTLETLSLAEAEIRQTTAPDDDPLAVFQWALDAIDAPPAWAAGHTGTGVRVAILDSGIDADHPDLAPNVDHHSSISFVPGESWDIPPGVYGHHGTLVAGIIGAADNGLGIVGVAPEVELVAVKVLSNNGTGGFGALLQGLVHAVEVGAQVINLSLGADVSRATPGMTELLVAVGRATTWATQQGALVVAAVGNSARDLDHDASLVAFPAELPNVLAVAATGPIGWGLDPGTDLDHPAPYSSYGQSAVDLAAPGGSPITVGGSCSIPPFPPLPCWAMDFVLSTVSEGWGFSLGTSLAAPHVAGVAALVIGAHDGDIQPHQVIRLLERGADDLGKPGNDDHYGRGRVNATRSLD